MSSPSTPSVTPERSLAILRLLWAAMVGTIIVFGIVLVVILQSASPQPQPSGKANLDTIFTIVGFVLLLTEVPVGLFLRNQFYKKNWQGDVVTPGGYFTGNLLLLAMLEGIALFSLVTTLVVRSFGLVTVPALIALALLLLNFPTGKPMMPAGNPYQTPLGR